MIFSLAFSPCPNDTFIFDALVNKKIDTKGLNFNVYLEDVQTLNEWAFQGKIDFTKLSYGALPLVLHNYKVLTSGGALGKGVGPLLISKKNISAEDIQNKNFTVVIPGKNTTAHFLFSMAFPAASNKIFLPFNEIETYVLQNENAFGVIIHENRFTYQQKGLNKILDLGAYWEKTKKLPIPLGCIAAHNRIDIQTSQLVNKLIEQSVAYAFKNNNTPNAYVQQYAQEMDEAVIKQHIDLYVNNYSINLGVDGKLAVQEFLMQSNTTLVNELDFKNIFVE